MNRNNKIILFFVLVLAGLTGLYMYKKYRVAPTIPLFTQKLLDETGAAVDLSSYKGKPLIISYYASWCGNCITELRDLNEVKEANLKGVTVICITDDPEDKFLDFQVKHPYPFEFYRLPVPFSTIDIHAIPVTYLINSKGEMVYNKVGELQWKDDSFMQYAKKLLE